MQFLDKPDTSAQIQFITKVHSDIGKWVASEIRLTLPEASNAVLLARELEQRFKNREGAVLALEKNQIRVFVNNCGDECFMDDFGADVAAVMNDTDCLLSFSTPVERDLQPIITLLTKKNERERHRIEQSTLFDYRMVRARNVTMVVDDDGLQCEALKNVLAGFGECVTLSEPDEVLDSYIRNIPDCLFLDLHLPQQHGLTLAEQILKYDRDAYIVVLTSDGTARQAAAAKSSGIKSFIAKPANAARIRYELFHCPTFRRYGG